tara:strand:- start:1482 stop:1853 length:372 start_codon:yes stop_codon:yes gene_type:complete
MKSKGLGDSIEKITKATGIKKATKYIFDKLGKDCGCDKRKEKLNKIFPYNKIECINEAEYITLKELYKTHKAFISASEQAALLEIHNRVFNDTRKPSTCSSCVKELYTNMKRLFDEYEQETQT